MKLYLKTLTPLHIGNGEILNALDYIIYNNNYYRISQNQFLKFLNNNQDLVNKYSDWILKESDDIEYLENNKKNERDRFKKQDFNQQLSQKRTEFNLLNFIKSINKTNDFIKFLDVNCKKIEINLHPKQQIRGLIQSPNNQPYIPGSSIKGAIRTALLFNFLNHKTKPTLINDILNNSLINVEKQKSQAFQQNKKFNIEKVKSSFADQIEQLAFYCEAINEKGVKKSDDEKFDLMKLVLISDGIINNYKTSLENIDLYLISKQKDRRTGQLNIEATQQKQAPSVETINSNNVIEFEIDFNIDFLYNIKDKLNNDSIKAGKEQIWIGIKDKVNKLFDIDITLLTKDNLPEYKDKATNHIIQCINNFSKAQLMTDYGWINEFSSKDSRHFYDKKIKNGYKTLDNKNNLIHFGYGTGFAGITELLFIKSKPELKETLKKVMELFLIGDKPGAQRNRRNNEHYIANPDKFPKSKRLITQNEKIIPLGWCEILKQKPEISKEISTASKDNIKPDENVIIKEKPIEPYKPQFFKGKITNNAQPIDAEVVQSGKPNKVKLFIENNQCIVDMTNYNSPLEKGTIVQVKLNQVTGKGEIKQVGFINMK